MSRNLRRIKNTTRPKNPKTVDALIDEFKNPSVMSKFGLNSRKNERFYMNTVRGNTFSFTIFASAQIMTLIENHVKPMDRRYLIDGTFQLVPIGFFRQLLIIHIEYMNDVSNQLIQKTSDIVVIKMCMY